MMMKTNKTHVDVGDVKKLAYLLAEHERAKKVVGVALDVKNFRDEFLGWKLLDSAWERKSKNNAEIIELLNKLVVQACKADKSNTQSESWLEKTVRDLYWNLVLKHCEMPLSSENDQGWLEKIGDIVSQTLNPYSGGAQQEAKLQ